VPIFLPVWWPHSFYNLRYGLELLPAFALGVGFAASFVLDAVREFKPAWTKIIAAAVFVVLVANAAVIVRERPLVYVEGTKNIDARRPYEQQIPPAMRALLATRPEGPVLMVTSVYPEIVALTGIPLRQTINEGDQALFSDALAAPAKQAALVLAFDGDAVDKAVRAHPEGLTMVRRFATHGQAPGTLYVSDTWRAQGSASTSAR
jgi:hypothetical protein